MSMISQYCFGCRKFICDVPSSKWKEYMFCRKCVLEIDEMKLNNKNTKEDN